MLGVGVVALTTGCGAAGLGASLATPGASPSSTSSQSTGALAGQVVARTTCGVQNPVATCTPAPVSGAVVTVRTTNGAVVATVTSDTYGQFRLTLTPGYYLAQARSGFATGATDSAPTSVTVESGQTTTVQLVVSSPPRP